MGKNFREVLRNLIGIDDESVVRLKRIDGKAVSARERIWQTLHGLRPASTQEFLAVMKFCADYGIGTPVKMQADGVQKASVLFVTQHGYMPFDARAYPEVDARSRAMNLENDAKLQLEAAERSKPEVVIESEPAKAEPEGETLEIVSELPETFTPPNTRERGR